MEAVKKTFWQDETPASTRRERRKQEIRVKIIEAAIDLFESKGIEETTLEEICETADISRPTFYSYYASKHELIIALAEKLWLSVANDVTTEALTNHESTQQYIDVFFKLIRAEIVRYGRLERELVRHSMSRDPNDLNQNSTMLRALISMFTAVYAEGRKRGDIGNRYPLDFMAETSLGCISSVMVNWALDESYPIDRRLKQTADFLTQMLELTK